MKLGKCKHFYLVALASVLPLLGLASGEKGFSSLEDEYTPLYCNQLEAAYGAGMMSEGGAEGIEAMFDAVPIDGKAALDIGSGLGAVAFHLAEHHAMQVTGLEVNPWMVKEAQSRMPVSLNGKVQFVLSTSNCHWPFADASFEMIYSKGVLTHIESKEGTFQECYRLLKPQGLLVIVDWLSADSKEWGENIAKLVELENLALFPESESGYIDLLKKSGFTVLSVSDESPTYANYNWKIVERLKNPELHSILLEHFDEAGIAAAIEGYTAIARAQESGEVRTMRFVVQKD